MLIRYYIGKPGSSIQLSRQRLCGARQLDELTAMTVRVRALPLLRQFEHSSGDGVLGYRKFMAQAAENLSQDGLLEVQDGPRGEFR